MTTLTIQLNDDLKAKLETFARKRGQSLLESAYDLLNQGFEVAEEVDEDVDLDGPYTEEEDALLYSPENVEAILETVKELDEGKRVLVTIEELRAMIK